MDSCRFCRKRKACFNFLCETGQEDIVPICERCLVQDKQKLSDGALHTFLIKIPDTGQSIAYCLGLIADPAKHLKPMPPYFGVATIAVYAGVS